MLIGEYIHIIDSKKRLAIPAKFRKELGTKAVITKGLDQCLVLYPIPEWERVAESLGKLPTGQSENRSFVRDIFSGASDVEIDALGRILIPEYLKKFANLEEKVVIVGVYKRLEIWDEQRWNEYKDRIEKQTDVLAEKMGQLGVY